MLKENYPQEVFIKLENNHDQFVGRITLNKSREKFHVEVDILFSESKKIYIHVGSLYNFPDSRDGVEQGVQLLAKFVRGKK